MAFTCKFSKQIVDLLQVLALGERRVLYDRAPAVRVRQAGVPYGFKQIVSSVDGCNWTVQSIFDNLSRACKSWSLVSLAFGVR